MTITSGIYNTATNLLGGNNNHLISQGGYQNQVYNFIGSNNALTVGGAGSNWNWALNALSSGNDVTAGGPGGNFTAGFNFLGGTNIVNAGPGPLALAGTIFANGQTVTKVGPGIAINNFRIGGAQATGPPEQQGRLAERPVLAARRQPSRPEPPRVVSALANEKCESASSAERACHVRDTPVTAYASARSAVGLVSPSGPCRRASAHRRARGSRRPAA